jgi:hypothetical protein
MGKKLTTGQLSRATGIPLITISDWCRTGRIRACQPISGLRWRIPMDEARRIGALAGIALPAIRHVRQLSRSHTLMAI